MSRDFNSIADLGYISFYYGCRNPGEWEVAKYQYKDCLLLADSHSFRSDIILDYKGRRKKNREAKPSIQMTYEKVKALRQHIMDHDPHSMIAQVPGAEADDLVAAFHLAYPDLKYIVAIDKDYLQLRNFNEKQYTATMEQTAVKEMFKTLPQYVTNFLPDEITPQIIVLIHAVFGDKSDSIPRLLSSHITQAKLQWHQIWGNHHSYSGINALSMYQRAHTMFRHNFTRNLNLVILPGNQLRNEPLDSTELIHGIADGSYWDASAWSALIHHALYSVKERAARVMTNTASEWADLQLD